MAKIKIKTGPGDGTYIKPTTPLDTTADVRDILSFIAGKGANMADPDVKASYGRLAALK